LLRYQVMPQLRKILKVAWAALACILYISGKIG